MCFRGYWEIYGYGESLVSAHETVQETFLNFKSEEFFSDRSLQDIELFQKFL
jgi:hypothetical protein